MTSDAGLPGPTEQRGDDAVEQHWRPQQYWRDLVAERDAQIALLKADLLLALARLAEVRLP